MNDDSLTPEAELASAALDNEVTEAERARVTGTQSLRDELAFYADLRDRLADVPVPEEARESALAAALAVFDQIQATASEPAPEPEPEPAVAAAKVSGIARVVSLHERRQRQYRWIGSAAAAAFVAVLAVGVLGNLLGGSDDDESSNAALLDPTDTVQKSAEAPPTPFAAGQAQESTTGDAETAAAAEAPQTMNESSEPSGELDEINSPASLSEWFDAPRLESDDDLIAFVGSDAFAAPRDAPADDASGSTEASSAETTASPATSAASAATTEAAATGSVTGAAAPCPQLSIGQSAPVTYQGREVYVVVDEGNREVLIVDPVTCVADDPVRLP